MTSNAKTVNEYIKGLPADRRAAISAVRKVVLDNLPRGYEECMSYGIIGYVIPHSIYPAGYHCDPKVPMPYAGLASQKNHMALYVMSVYGDNDTEKWFRKTWATTGKKLDMGKCCIRFKKLEDIPLDVIGKLIGRVSVKDWIAVAEQARADRDKRAAKRKSK